MILFSSHFSSCRTKENGNGEEENTYPQGQRKEKDLVYQKGKQGLKTMQFYLWQTLSDFVQMGVDGVC